MHTRIYAILVVFLLFFSTMPGAAGAAGAASDTEAAKAALKQRVDAILSILQDPAYDELTPEKDKEQREKLTTQVNQIFDWPELSMRAVGPYWKNFSEQERKDFADAFATLLEATYLDQVRGNAQGTVQYIGEREGKKGRVEVQTKVVTTGKEIPIDYRMHENDGKWMVYDIIAEGVSLVKNYRSQFSELLLNNSPAEVIETVRDKAAKLENKQGA